jgi:biopolymer transport protein TolQ
MNIAYASTAASSEKVSAGLNFSAWDALSSASWPVQVTLLILVLMSVVCWAIIFTKKKTIDQTRDANKPFLDVFWNAASLDDIFSKVDRHPNSSIARVFRAGYLELRKMVDSNLSQSSKEQATPMLSGIDNLERSLRKAIDLEMNRLETRLSFLATTGSTGPFIGLFGTVWGIMGSFHKIGATGMANLAVVAPGISEALIATAIGLAAAIPATVAYNHFATLLQREETEMNSFASDFLNIAKRNFFKDR